MTIPKHHGAHQGKHLLVSSSFPCCFVPWTSIWHSWGLRGEVAHFWSGRALSYLQSADALGRSTSTPGRTQMDRWIDGSMNTGERVVVSTSVADVCCQHSITAPRVAVFGEITSGKQQEKHQTQSMTWLLHCHQLHAFEFGAYYQFTAGTAMLETFIPHHIMMMPCTRLL